MVLRQGGDLAQVGTFYSPQKGPGNCTRPLPSASKAETGRAAVLSVFLMNLAARPLRQLLTVTVGGGIAALSVSYDSCKRPEEPRRYRRVPRCIARRRAWVVSSPRHVGAAPRRDKFGGLRDMSSTLAQGAAGVPNWSSGSSPGRLVRRVLSEERGKRCSPRPSCGYSRATPRSATRYLNCRRCQPSQSAGPHQPAFALGSPDGVACQRFGGGGGVLLQSPA